VRLTDAIRPVSFHEHFDPGSRQHLISTYTEASLDARAHWLGHPIDLYPADLVALQEILQRTRPTHVVFAYTEPGLAVFVDSILKLLDVPSPLFIWASPKHPAPEGLKAKVKAVGGEPISTKAIGRVADLVGTAESTLVLYGVDATPKLAPEHLADYARFVGHRCYLVALRTAHGQPWIGYARLRAQRVITEMVREDPSLVIDTSWDRNVLSSCPSGFVLRVGASEAYDASLDELSAPVS
jgi:cephalosporin hydroxylase